jgi:WD40 repeat protein
VSKLFGNEYADQKAPSGSLPVLNPDKNHEKKEYIVFIAEKTPWFVGDIILCLIDLQNINFIASGSYDKKIRLWDLRTGKSDKYDTSKIK